MLVAICEPSQSISEQYQAIIVTLKNGSSLYGRIIYRNDKEVAVAPNPFNFRELTKTPDGSIEKIEPSQISMKPEGMIMAMNPQELQDLIAYLTSGGIPSHPAFRKATEENK